MKHKTWRISIPYQPIFFSLKDKNTLKYNYYFWISRHFSEKGVLGIFTVEVEVIFLWFNKYLHINRHFNFWNILLEFLKTDTFYVSLCFEEN